MHGRELWELANHVFRRMEQDAGMGFAEHGGVVVRVASSDNAVVQALEGDDRLTLGILLAQLVADHTIILVGDQAVAQQSRETELTHQRLGELVEGVGENHHLKTFTQPVDELHCAIERLQGSDHVLNVLQLQAVLIENAQALLHQHVVIGDVAGGRLERLDAGFFRKGDPDFRDQYAFQVETRDFHRPLLG